MTKLQKFEQAFKTQFPKAWYRVGDFYGEGETVLWSGEDNFHNGLPLFDYYCEVHEEGIHPEVEKLAEKHGFYFECYDAGTYIAVEL